MDLQSSKIELAKLILSLENPDIIEKIKDLLKKEAKGTQISLTDHEKAKITMAIKMLDAGERRSFDDFLKKVS